MSLQPAPGTHPSSESVLRLPSAALWCARVVARSAAIALLVLPLAGVTSTTALAQSDEDPPLPPGLEETGPGDEDPPLPPGLGDEVSSEAEDAMRKRTLAERLPAGLHGFWELRLGPRLQNDPAIDDDLAIAETRVQAEYERFWNRIGVDVKLDVAPDAVVDEIDLELRGARLTARAGGAFDLRAGRQVLSWGTGDLLFINDLFPKDWQSFFIGRDEEYLKAPSDALRLGFYPTGVGVELAYAPEFEPDRYIRGERISYFNPALGDFVGQNAPILARPPDDLFDTDETALRIYRPIGSFEVAAYGYRGFWKSPGGIDPVAGLATFPRLDVWGASARGPVGPGIGNVEVGWYDSRDDDDGSDPFVNNSELRLLLGYEQELAHELTGAFQYYLEKLLDYDRYLASLASGEPRDEHRHLLTFRLTRLLMNQNLTLSLFTFWSPSDSDAYLRPRATYKLTDHWTVEGGANVFRGSHDYTFFGQFENNTNVYAGVRYSL